MDNTINNLNGIDNTFKYNYSCFDILDDKSALYGISFTFNTEEQLDKLHTILLDNISSMIQQIKDTIKEKEKETK